MIFSDEYLYYNKKTDQFQIKVYSQEMMGHYWIMGLNENGTENIYYPSLFTKEDSTFYEQDLEFIDIIQERTKSEWNITLGQ